MPPDEVLAQIRQIAATLPVDPLILRAGWPGMDPDWFVSYLDDLGSRLVPRDLRHPRHGRGGVAVLGIHHAGIVVSDLDRAIDFYTGVLGLRLMTEPSPPASGPRMDRVWNLTGARVRASALLQKQAPARSKCTSSRRPEWTGPTPMPSHAIGAQHVAFQSEDLAAEKAAIESRGGVFTTDVHLVESGPFEGLKTAFLLDPDGVRIEFVEVSYWRDEERRAGVARYWAQR